MNKKFVPLAATLAAAAQSGPASKDFSPLSFASHPPAQPACAGRAEPTVTLEREGERVTRIKVRCSCGQIIELDCVD